MSCGAATLYPRLGRVISGTAAHAILAGIPLETSSHTTEVKIGGYADGTAIYLADSCDVPRVLEVLHTFGLASGLRANLKKSIVFPLHEHGELNNAELHGMAVLQRDTLCRYSGIQVRRSDGSNANWTLCEKSVNAWLSLA